MSKLESSRLNILDVHCLSHILLIESGPATQYSSVARVLIEVILVLINQQLVNLNQRIPLLGRDNKVVFWHIVIHVALANHLGLIFTNRR